MAISNPTASMIYTIRLSPPSKMRKDLESNSARTTSHSIPIMNPILSKSNTNIHNILCLTKTSKINFFSRKATHPQSRLTMLKEILLSRHLKIRARREKAERRKRRKYRNKRAKAKTSTIKIYLPTLMQSFSRGYVLLKINRKSGIIASFSASTLKISTLISCTFRE